MPIYSIDQVLPNMPDPVPNGLEPFPDESLPGFVLRMAENHGYSNPLAFLKTVGPHITSLRKAAMDVDNHQKMAAYLALRPDEVDRLCYGPGPDYRILGHEIHRDFLGNGTRRLCPLCIREARYHRAFWDLTVATVCPLHAIRLIDRCPECGHSLNWRVGPITSCSNPKCIGDVQSADGTPVAEAEMTGVRGLHRLLYSGNCPELNPAIRALSVSEQIRLICYLGYAQICGQVMLGASQLRNCSPDKVHLALEAGWQMCVTWPSSFHVILDRQRARAGNRKGRYGVRKQFGRLHRYLEENRRPFARVLEAELRSYILDRPEIITRAPKLRPGESDGDLRKRAVTISEARDVLHVGLEKMHALADERDLYFVRPTGSGAPAVLRADLVYALQEERSRLRTKEEVLGMLQTSKPTVDKLRQAGLLPAVPDPDNEDGLLYPADGVQALLQDLESRIPAGSTRPKQRVDMMMIARRVRRPGFDMADVVQAVRDGRLVPVALARVRGLHRLLFRPADVERFVAEVRARADETISIVEAAEELGVKQETAYQWVRKGLLRTLKRTSPTESGRRVTRAALEAFRCEYVTGAEFARVHRLGRKWAATHLVNAGVRAVSGPTVDGTRQYLFRRADLEGVDVARLVSGRSKLRPTVAQARRLDRAASEGFKYAIGRALKREFGEGLVRHYHRYQDPATGTVVQVMTASNIGTAGTYGFLISTKHRDELSSAEPGFLALGFADRTDFLLVPWREVEPTLGSLPSHDTRRGRVWRLWIRADAEGRLAPFGGHTRPLRQDGVMTPVTGVAGRP